MRIDLRRLRNVTFAIAACGLLLVTSVTDRPTAAEAADKGKPGGFFRCKFNDPSNPPSNPNIIPEVQPTTSSGGEGCWYPMTLLCGGCVCDTLGGQYGAPGIAKEKDWGGSIAGVYAVKFRWPVFGNPGHYWVTDALGPGASDIRDVCVRYMGMFPVGPPLGQAPRLAYRMQIWQQPSQGTYWTDEQYTTLHQE